MATAQVDNSQHRYPHRYNKHLTHPKYRADIDGLRAIAVLSVVGFHAFPQLVKGGFIGVDIFFVISGYLISTIIFDSLERDSFSFIEFYSRRIKRIFPALLLVLIASFAFGLFALLADEYKQLGKHIAGGAGFVSNFILWDESGYFDNAAETKPLLHLWSLGVEEQFYIFWPLLLWLAWKWRLSLLAISLAVALVSFALNIGNLSSDIMASFYLPQARFWELMAGAVLAYMALHKRTLRPMHKFDAWLGKIAFAPETNGKTLCNIQSISGLALIVVGLLVITNEKRFPGWWAVLPTLGSALVISAGVQAWFNRVVLSSRVLVWIGLISYPLYLWHWPLLSFLRIVENETPSRGMRIAVVAISILLAWMTYRLVERPIRFGKSSKEKTAALIILMVVVGYVGYSSYREGLTFKIKTAVGQASITSISANIQKIENGLRHEPTISSPVQTKRGSTGSDQQHKPTISSPAQTKRGSTGSDPQHKPTILSPAQTKRGGTGSDQQYEPTISSPAQTKRGSTENDTQHKPTILPLAQAKQGDIKDDPRHELSIPLSGQTKKSSIELYDEKISANPTYIEQVREVRAAATRFPYCHLKKEDETFEEFQLGIDKCLAVSNNQINILVMGDSHAADLYMALAGTHKDYNFLQATGAGCTPSRLPSSDYKHTLRCMQLIDYAIKFVRNNTIDAVILAGRWPKNFEAVENRINELRPAVGKIFLAGPINEYTEPPDKFIARRPKDVPIEEYARKFIVLERSELNAKMKNFADANGILYIDKIEGFCRGEGACPLVSPEGDLLMLPGAHLTKAGAMHLGEGLLEKQAITRHFQVEPSL